MTDVADRFRPADLAHFVDVLAADLSPGADAVVFVANTRDGSSALEQGVLWYLPLGASVPRILTASEGSQTAPSISPDGGTVAFLQIDGGRAQLRCCVLASGAVTVLTDVARGVAVQTPCWSPDGTQLAFAASTREPRDPARPYRITRPVWRRDGMGLVEDALAEVHVVPALGGEPRQLTAHDGIVSSLQWSPDGTQLMYGCFAEPGSREVSIRIVDVVSGAVQEVLTAEYLAYPPAAAWLPDGRIVHTTPWDITRPLDLVVFDPATGESQARGVELAGQIFGMLQSGMDASLYEPRIVVQDDGQHVLLYVQDGGQLVTYRISTCGPVTTAVVAGSDVSTVPLAIRGDTLLVARTSLQHPSTLHMIDLAHGSEQPLAGPDRSLLATAPFAVHSLWFHGEDGTDVEGWFLEPTTGTGPHPTVLNIHGGPFAGYGQMFSVDNHLLTSAGFGVLLVNYRGSSGYGEKFAATQWGDWGHHDAGDLLQGLAAAVDRGWVDPSRVGSFGLSGGGYLTSWLLTHSDAFRAGIAECPVTDWNGMVGSDIPQVLQRWMGAVPGGGVEAMAQFARVAPLTYATECTTPMLIIEHEADLRCPAGQGDSFYNALVLADREVEMLRLPGMFHTDVYGTGDLAGRVARAEAIVEWMERHVMGVSEVHA
jgi:dipeptidyl aminopeptidase/acylaminoacyl peptidase